MWVAFPMNKILKSSAVRSRVENSFNFIVFFIVNKERGRSLMRIRMKESVFGVRSNE